jgi:hypothetical protein
MWAIMTSSALATAVVDYTTEFSPLLVGLVSIIWFSVGIIVVAALRDCSERRAEPKATTTSVPTEHRSAA